MKQLSWIVLLLTISTFSQTPGNGLTDIDGNQYNSVIIGTQEWMKENLNVSKYTDGTPIPQVTDPTAWTNLTTGAWCYYNNDPANGAIYGKLYNFFAVLGIYDNASSLNSALRKKLIPTGWGLPPVNNNNQMVLLANYLGGEAVAGGKMKSTGTTNWTSPNNGATNSSGFTGLPGGTRGTFGFFSDIGTAGFWWPHTSDGGSATQYYYLTSSLPYFIEGMPNNGNQRTGFSVRGVKNSSLDNNTFNSLNLFNIYPNPAKNQIIIDLDNNSNDKGLNYRILNTLGQEVLKGVLNSQQNIIELNNIKGQGVYFVKVYDSSNTLLDTKKIIIQQ